MDNKRRNILCFGLILMAILIILTTGCGKKSIDTTEGTMEGYTYQETEDVTNYVKIVTNQDKVIKIK